MEIQQSYLDKFHITRKGEPRNEREELLDKFLAKLNLARIGTAYAPLTIGRLVKILEGVPTKDLYAFLRDCERARSFSKYFFWALKPKP